MNRRTLLILIGLILIGGIIGLIVAFYMWNKPHRDIAEEEVAFTVTADDIYNEYQLNEQAANEKYLDQVVQVTGVVEDVAADQEGKPMLILSAEEAMMGGVSATLMDEAAVRADAVEVGDEVTLKCRSTGLLMDVVLIDCSFANKEE